MGLGTLGAYSRWIEPSWVEWTQKTLPIPDLPPFWEGKTILHISDLHAGGSIEPLTMAQWLMDAQKLEPDVVVTTGDIIDSSAHPEKEALIGMLPKGKLGSFWVFGNHDVGKRDATRRHLVLRSLLEPARCLENQRVEISGLAWVGTQDYIMGDPLPRDQGILKDDGMPVIALTHNPKELSRAYWQGQRGWMLAGHTHGGQICLGLETGLIYGNKPHPPQGIIPPENGGMGLHISRGLGQHHPCRFRARPEISFLKLTRTRPAEIQTEA